MESDPLYNNECATCEYVMSFATNDWYICDENVVCRYGGEPDDHIAAPISDLADFEGMMCQAKVVYNYWLEKKKALQIPRLLQ